MNNICAKIEKYFKNKQWGLKNYHNISIVVFEILVFKIPKFYCIDAALHSVQVLANSRYCLATSNAAERVPMESTYKTSNTCQFSNIKVIFNLATSGVICQFHQFRSCHSLFTL